MKNGKVSGKNKAIMAATEGFVTGIASVVESFAKALGMEVEYTFNFSKVILFPIGNFGGTMQTAFVAAEAHRQALVAAGNAWASDPPCDPMAKLDGTAAGLYISTLIPALPEPIGASRVRYYWAEFHDDLPP